MGTAGMPESPDDPRRSSAGAPTSPFDETPVISGEVLDPSDPRGGRRRMGAFTIIGTLVGDGRLPGGRDVRGLLASPLRWVAVLVLVPSLVSGALGLAIDSGARVLGFLIAVLGVILAVALEIRRRSIVGPRRAPTDRTTAANPAPKLSGIVGLVMASLVTMAVAMGFVVLAVLLLIFQVW